jgi:hypothetical protein
MQKQREDFRKNPGGGFLTMPVLDTAYDVASLVLGHDLFTGEKLSHGEELFTFSTTLLPAISAGVFKYGPVMDAAGDVLRRGADAVGDLSRRGAW